MLMTAKSSSAYSAGLTYFKRRFWPLNIQIPQTFITDFEISLVEFNSIYISTSKAACWLFISLLPGTHEEIQKIQSITVV
ncbi:hypothetical protein KQX54_013352 [Cotesia glomerata]|uniref:Uncharacterized protein n=1 Tax=Cotesia glomerata TaxID=32391 RepID=A0AAV7IHA8_COTGL|nr:hypothetical protein KQX54_013352 [Cotesia glomerata]